MADSSDLNMSLDSRILRSLAISDFPPGWKQKYMPDGILDDLIKESDIVEALWPAPEEVNQSSSAVKVNEALKKFVLKSAKKVLAISLLSGIDPGDGLRRAMESFMKRGFTDGKLPVTSQHRRDHPWSEIRPPWSESRSVDFLDKQWWFLVPVFRSNGLRLEIGNQRILPFKLVGSGQRREGTFSDVWKVEIHEAHQQNPMQKLDGSGERAHAAIKALKALANEPESDTYKLWRNESKALEDIAGLHHKHIMEVKAIISWEGKGNYFMFQWADGGSLRDLYSKMQRPKLDPSFVREIIQQLVGLASALDKLHNYKKDKQDNGSYRHGDLKPENILLFEDGTKLGLFKISDMGLAKHHIDATGLRVGPTVTRYGTPLYEPPEVILDAEAARSRRYDIWSMGCVIFELIVWLLYGYGELTKFNHKLYEAVGYSSPYWAMEEEEEINGKEPRAIVHPNVVDCMALISKDLNSVGSTAIGDLLLILKSKLLVVPLSRNSATFGTHGSSSATPLGHRASARELQRDLQAIMDKPQADANYWSPIKLQQGLRGPIDDIKLLSAVRNRNVPTVKRQEVCPIFLLD